MDVSGVCTSISKICSKRSKAVDFSYLLNLLTGFHINLKLSSLMSATDISELTSQLQGISTYLIIKYNIYGDCIFIHGSQNVLQIKWITAYTTGWGTEKLNTKHPGLEPVRFFRECNNFYPQFEHLHLLCRIRFSESLARLGIEWCSPVSPSHALTSRPHFCLTSSNSKFHSRFNQVLLGSFYF